MKNLFCYTAVICALTSCATKTDNFSEILKTKKDSSILSELFYNKFRSNCVAKCTQQNNNIESCNCYADEIIRTFNDKDFFEMQSFIKENKTPAEIISSPTIGPKIIKASQKCTSKN